MSGHTKGPWRVRENPRHNPDCCDLSICGDIFILADINGPQYSHQEANARLIAAAPEMLEALASLETYLRDTPHHNAPEAAAARAVIRKATGESA